jgi:hypothetical protein
MRVGLIGPTDKGMQAQFIGHSIPFLEERGALVGTILAEMGKELWVNADGGMLFEVAKSYKEHGGIKLVMLLPSEESDDWPIEHARPFATLGDEVRRPFNWAAANREVVTIPEIVVCVGFSSGTSSELALASIRWNIKLLQDDPDSARPLIAIRELLRGRQLIPEHEYVLFKALQYVDTVEELRPVLKRLQEQAAELMPP